MLKVHVMAWTTGSVGFLSCLSPADILCDTYVPLIILKICLIVPLTHPCNSSNSFSQAKTNSVSNTRIGTPATTQAAAEALAAEERVPGDSSSTLLRDPTTASPEDQGPRALTCMLPMSGATASQGIARPACIERRVLATPVMLCAPAGACTELGGGGAEMVAQDLPDAVYDRLQVRTCMCLTIFDLQAQCTGG